MNSTSSQALPFVVEAPRGGATLHEFLGAELPTLELRLRQSGAILLRGFAPEPGGFRLALAAAGHAYLDYDEPSTPRSAVEDKIYTSTEYPANQPIPLHNEMSYRRSFPERLWFYCETAAPRGGATTLCDFRRIYQQVPAAIRDQFERRGVMYERVFNTGFDLTWEHVYGTRDRAAVEARLVADAVDFAWLSDDQLRTRTVVPAVLRGEDSGVMAWFNQAHLFHASSQPPRVRNALRDALGADRLPRHARFGDGGEIADAMLDEIRALLDAATVPVQWQPGDLLLVDNLTTAHGRDVFEGERRVLVAMSGLRRAGAVQ